MDEIKEKYLRPCGRITDQFVIASILTIMITVFSALIIPAAVDSLILKFFESLLGGDRDVAFFLYDYFMFISLWIVIFLVVIIFKGNRPMLQAVKYCSPGNQGGEGNSTNHAGNNIRGFLTGLALGFGCNGFCILMSALTGDIHLEYRGFKLLPFVLFFICVFIQSAGEELTVRWYLYQKLRRRYRTPWIAIVINMIVFTGLHLLNPGITILAVIQIFVSSLLFSLFVYYYNGLWIAAAFHAAWNFTQSIIFGLPNSGLVSAFSVFKLDAASATNGLFYNVNFGVEGSTGALLVLIAAVVVLVLINRGKSEQTDVWAAIQETPQ